jgi:glycosyltransferase involved in cell wall biosynthesis
VCNYFDELNLRRFVMLAVLPKVLFIRSREQRYLRILNVYTQFAGNMFVAKLFAEYILGYGRSVDCFADGPNEVKLRKAVIIKPFVSSREKGIILIKFENQLRKVVTPRNMAILQKRYQIVFMPSSAGFFSKELIALAVRSTDRFFVMPSHAHERDLCRCLGNFCIPLPFNAASWIKAERFDGYKGPRDIDCLMVAIFADVKRHWLLFKVLRKLPENIKAVCVGIPYNGRTADVLYGEASRYGVADRVTIIERPTQKKLSEYFQRAKVFCAFTHKEGSFVAVAEALLAGTPVVMFKNAVIGTRDLIDGSNGMFVSSVSDARKSIEKLLRECDHESIRRSSQQNISAAVNCDRLNRILLDSSKAAGCEWSIDIERFHCVQQEFFYEQEESYVRLKSDYDWLRSNGIELSLPKPEYWHGK